VHLEAEATTGEIQWTASRGLGYEYRWDFDSDGEWDTDWTEDASPSHDYEGAAYYGLVAILEAPRQMFGPTELEVAQDDDPVRVPVDLLGPDWARDPETSTVPPTLRYVDGAMQLRINGAAITDRDGEDDGVMTLSPGDTLSFGGARMTVAVQVRGTVEVRNPFGNLARRSEHVTLRVPRQVARAEVRR